MTVLLIGYARCSTDQQDLTAQRDGLTGTNRERPGLPERSRRAGKATPLW
jgi:hypothetical protein